jgi:predicted porin
MMKKILIIVFMALLIASVNVFANDDNETLGTSDVARENSPSSMVYKFPIIQPELHIYGGYRITDLSGSERAEEYEYLKDSFLFGGELRLFSPPHRLHFDVDLKNSKDYLGDITYSYGEKAVLRVIINSLYHNLDTISLVDLDISTPSPGIDVRDAGEKYGYRTGFSDIFLRVKPVDFPLHFYVDGFLLKKSGSKQQRHMLGAGYFNNIVRASQKRDVDWETREVKFGANSHLGPIEIDIYHTEKRFDAGSDSVLFDDFSSAGFGPPGTLRVGGIFPHNLIPETESSTNALRLHTTYTGRLVATATFLRTDKENRDGGSEADYFIGAGEVIWVPRSNVSLFIKYRHKDSDINNPETVSIADVCDPSNNRFNSYSCDIKPSVSSTTDTISGTVRYRPLSRLTLRANYSYKDIRRDNAEEWDIPHSTQKNTALLSVNAKVAKGLRLKAKYTHREINNPAHNIEPDSSDEGDFSVSWIPVRRVHTLLSYSIKDEERDDLHFADTEEAENRDVRRDRFLGSITFLVLDDLSVTASYAYLRNKIEQDIEYHDTAGDPHIDPDVPYRDKTDSYSLDVSYIPKDHLTINAGITHTNSSGLFTPNDVSLLEPVPVASFSSVKIKETIYSLSGEYEFKGGFTSGIQYRFTDFNDEIDSPYDDVEDGKAHVILLTLSKKW